MVLSVSKSSCRLRLDRNSVLLIYGRNVYYLFDGDLELVAVSSQVDLSKFPFTDDSEEVVTLDLKGGKLDRLHWINIA